MSRNYPNPPSRWKTPSGSILFFAAVCFIYMLVFFFFPAKAYKAMGISVRLLIHILIPLGFVFLILLAINFFLKPAQVARYFGKAANVKGLVLAVAGGILSTGPIYAWYPLLRGIKEKGASNRMIAVFLFNRSVKPFIWPVMVSYFGPVYVLALTFFMIAGSLAAGYLVGAWVKDD